MQPRRIVELSRCALALLLVGLSISAGNARGDEAKSETADPPAKKQTAKPASSKEQSAKTYTNADLDRMFGRASRPRPEASPSDEPSSETTGSDASAEAAPVSPLEQVLEQERLARQREKEIAAATAKVAEAQKRASDLEKRALAVKNPFLRRPEAPEQGREEWDAADARGRLEQNEQQLETAREDLVQAQKELVALRGH